MEKLKNETNYFSVEDKVNATFFPKHQHAIYKRLHDKHTFIESFSDDDPLHNKIVLNLGPQHPATHGVLRLVTELDGETITKCVLDLGYLHRGVEKIAEHKTFQEFMPYTDRLDYLSPYSNNVGFCLAVEKIAGIEVPERAQYLRTIANELARISAHLLSLGTGVMDAGAISVFMYTFRERETIYDIFDKFAGVRFTVSHSRIGGVQFDVDDSVLDMIGKYVKHFMKELAGWKKLLNKNPIWINRNLNIGTITREEAINYGFTGPNLRGSGIAYDVRVAEPYLVYDQLDFDVPVRTEGDALARYFVRLEEMVQSVRIIEQCLAKIPKGPVRTDNTKKGFGNKDNVYYSMEGLIHDFVLTDLGITLEDGAEVYHAIEAPKGELGYYIKSDGSGTPWRMKIKSPSFANLQVLEKMMEGQMIADTVVLIGSIDPVMGEADK